MNNLQLEKILNEKLSPQLIKDYAPNGMQVEGKSEIKRIVTGVTASQALIDKAIELEADALLVHHGYFWKGEPEPIRGMKGKRIRSLIKSDINLYGYHLPLDIHPELGNNVELARLLDIEVEGGLEGPPQSVAMFGRLKQAMTGADFANKINHVLNREPLHIDRKSTRLNSSHLPLQCLASVQAPRYCLVLGEYLAANGSRKG